MKYLLRQITWRITRRLACRRAQSDIFSPEELCGTGTGALWGLAD